MTAPHLSSTLLCSSLLTFSMSFRLLNQRVAWSGAQRLGTEIRWVTGISKSASHLGSVRLTACRPRSRNTSQGLTEQCCTPAHFINLARLLTRARPDEGRRSRRGGNAAALAGYFSNRAKRTNAKTLADHVQTNLRRERFAAEDEAQDGRGCRIARSARTHSATVAYRGQIDRDSHAEWAMAPAHRDFETVPVTAEVADE